MKVHKTNIIINQDEHNFFMREYFRSLAFPFNKLMETGIPQRLEGRKIYIEMRPS